MDQKHINKQLSNMVGADGGDRYTPRVIPREATDEPTTTHVWGSCNLATNCPIYMIEHSKMDCWDIIDPFCNKNHVDWTIIRGDMNG
jgi:hypothetical protein